ncbi:MAG: hypothetical protein ACREQ9_05090 [Candidatus Binatia bacterium]
MALDPRVREIAERLTAMVDSGHPLSGFVVSYFKAMLDEWEDPGAAATPPPFGDSPLLRLVESMLPSVDAQDPESGTVIRTMMEEVRVSRDPVERRTLSYALEWFYLYFTRKTDLDFEGWLADRQKK